MVFVSSKFVHTLEIQNFECYRYVYAVSKTSIFYEILYLSPALTDLDQQ